MRVPIARAAEALRNKAREVQRRVQAAERQNGQEALQLARAYSSGTVSTRELVALGHPYAVRAPRPPGPPAIINRQTGRFLAGWHLVQERDRIRVVNSSKLSPLFARGTRRMIRRPIVRAVAQALRRRRERRLAQAAQLALDF